ncbi:MAG: hypothetical protein QM599_03260 [Pseudoxanthomonas sp.]
MKRIVLLLMVLAMSAPAFAAWESKKDKEINAWVATLPPPDADFGPYPDDYEKLVQSHFSEQLKDPDSAKFSDFRIKKSYVLISAPNKQAQFGYAVCVNINAKNSYGAYAGKTLTWAFIRDNAIVRSAMAESTDFNSKLDMAGVYTRGDCAQQTQATTP